MVVLYFNLCIVFIIKENFLVLCEHNRSDFEKKFCLFSFFFQFRVLYLCYLAMANEFCAVLKTKLFYMLLRVSGG